MVHNCKRWRYVHIEKNIIWQNEILKRKNRNLKFIKVLISRKLREIEQNGRNFGPPCRRTPAQKMVASENGPVEPIPSRKKFRTFATC